MSAKSNLYNHTLLFMLLFTIISIQFLLHHVNIKIHVSTFVYPATIPISANIPSHTCTKSIVNCIL